MDFVTVFPISSHYKGNSFPSILVILDWLTKMENNKPVKVIIDTPSLEKVIINIIVKHHGLCDSILSNCVSVLTLQFWSLLCCFLTIKQRLFAAFDL